MQKHPLPATIFRQKAIVFGGEKLLLSGENQIEEILYGLLFVDAMRAYPRKGRITDGWLIGAVAILDRFLPVRDRRSFAGEIVTETVCKMAEEVQVIFRLPIESFKIS